MGKLYSANEIAKLINVTPETIRYWEDKNLIPGSFRMTLRKKRLWGRTKAKLILAFARDNGYIIHDFALPSELRGNDDASS